MPKATLPTKALAESIKTTLCELAKDPSRFNGKMVSFRASIIGGRRGQEITLEDFTIREGCSAYMNIIMEMPVKVKPKPNFSFENDFSYQKFQAALREPVTIDATVDGRFDASFVWKNKMRLRVGEGNGFGRKHRAEGRLVVVRLSGVITHLRVPALVNNTQ